jgi:hypothetical protein
MVNGWSDKLVELALAVSVAMQGVSVNWLSAAMFD